jgi:protein TonB
VAAVTARPQVTSLDRFGLTLCLAIILHGIIILGVTFAPEDLVQPRYNTMEIILVQQRSQEAPEEADLLAQANLEGGGDVEEEVNPATPTPAPFPEQTPEITAPPPAEPAPPPEPVPPPAPEEVVETPEPEPKVIEETLVAETGVAEVPEPVEVEQPEEEIKPAEPVEQPPVVAKEETPPIEEKVEKPVPEKPRRKQPTAAALLTNSFKIASLSAEIRRKMETRAERPRRKFISASTQEFRYASYMEAWRAKVERVGNLNYPDEARRQRLSGSLILDVALNKDGSINQITVRRSSGHKVLDDAAVRIVQLASPFAPFPDQIREETDILHITRTWQFLNNRGFR